MAHRAARCRVVGITGTNGKTTTAVLVADALGRLGARPAALGTLGFSFEGVTREGSHTTPEADDISRLLSTVRERGGTHLVMEVSSHALSQERVAGAPFRGRPRSPISAKTTSTFTAPWSATARRRLGCSASFRRAAR